MTSDDRELDEWKGAWASEGPPVPDLSAWLRRAQRRHTRDLALSVLSAIALFVFYGVIAARSSSPAWTALGLAGCVFAALTSVLTVLGRRGTWRPASRSTRDYLELFERRARAKLRLLRISVWLAAAWAVLVGPPFVHWVWVELAPRSSPDFFAGVATGVLPLLGLGVWMLIRQRRQALQELREAGALLSELCGER